MSLMPPLSEDLSKKTPSIRSLIGVDEPNLRKELPLTIYSYPLINKIDKNKILSELSQRVEMEILKIFQV
jgi:hypothetical protein